MSAFRAKAEEARTSPNRRDVRLTVLFRMKSGGPHEGAGGASGEGRRLWHPGGDVHYRTVGGSMAADPLADMASRKLRLGDLERQKNLEHEK